MSDQQQRDKEKQSGNHPGDEPQKPGDRRQRQGSDNRRRSGRRRSRPVSSQSGSGEQRQPGENRPRKDMHPNAQDRQPEGSLPDTPIQAGKSGQDNTARQSKPGSRRRRGNRPPRPRGEQSEQPGSTNTSSESKTAEANHPIKRGPQPRPDFAPLPNPVETRLTGPGSSRRSRRNPKPETGQVEAHFIPPEPVQERKKNIPGSGELQRGSKSSINKRGGQKGRQPGGDNNKRQSPGSAVTRNTGNRASLNRRNSRRVFDPGRENESEDREPTGGQSTYVSLLGRFNPRPAPSTPIRTNRGIKARSQRGDFSQNWWARRWIKSMELLVDPARLQRGRSYARSGQVLSVQENPYGVEARVQGSRPAPYKVIIQLTPLTDDQWALVTDALAEQALFTAQLLAGEMPANIEDAFETAGVNLFPKLAGDLFSSCSCPDWANPCKHVAATHYILADRFDDDPFLLFRMRGRSQEQILAELNQRRGGLAENNQPDENIQASLLEDQPETEDLLDHFWEPAEPLDTFPLTINPPRIDMLLLTRLGEPAFVPGLSLLNILRPVYQRFTYAALRAAYSEDEPVESNPSELDDLLDSSPGE